MGRIFYGASDRGITVDDRALAHLKVAITTKLRRGESFSFSWDHGAEEGFGRSTIWVHPSIPLHFAFDGNRPARLNRTWVEQMIMLASTSGEMRVLTEPDEVDPEPRGR